MIATSVSYDLILLIHIAAALATVIVFVAMRVGARAVARGADAATQRLRFPERTNWAARFLHVLPITGLFLVAIGGSRVSFAHPWVGVGLLCYLAAAGQLEARTLPAERSMAEVIARDGVAPPALGASLVRSVDVLLAILAVALVTMLIQY